MGPSGLREARAAGLSLFGPRYKGRGQPRGRAGARLACPLDPVSSPDSADPSPDSAANVLLRKRLQERFRPFPGAVPSRALKAAWIKRLTGTDRTRPKRPKWLDSALQAGGHRFDPGTLDHRKPRYGGAFSCREFCRSCRMLGFGNDYGNPWRTTGARLRTSSSRENGSLSGKAVLSTGTFYRAYDPRPWNSI